MKYSTACPPNKSLLTSPSWRIERKNGRIRWPLTLSRSRPRWWFSLKKNKLFYFILLMSLEGSINACEETKNLLLLKGKDRMKARQLRIHADEHYRSISGDSLESIQRYVAWESLFILVAKEESLIDKSDSGGLLQLLLESIDRALIVCGPANAEHLLALMAQLENTIMAFDGTEDSRINFSIPNIPTDSSTIPIYTRPSFGEFNRILNQDAHPFILSGEMEEWPAMERWPNLDYILGVCGHRSVPVEIGRDYRDGSWKQSIMTIRRYIGDHVISEDPEEIAYIAQFNLLDHVPALQADIATPEYCEMYLCDDDDDEEDRECASSIQRNVWFGMKGTVTPLHYDRYHNLFAQVVGYKRIRLYDRAINPNLLHPFPPGSGLTNTSQVRLEDPPAGFGEIPFTEVVVGPGQILYIPPGWWHHVEALSFSISVSFWF